MYQELFAQFSNCTRATWISICKAREWIWMKQKWSGSMCFEVSTVVYQWAIHFYLISLSFFVAHLFSTLLFIVKFFVGCATYAVVTCFAQIVIEPSRTEDDSSEHLVVQNSAVIPLVSTFTLLAHIQFIIIIFLLTSVLHLFKISWTKGGQP